VVLAAAYLTLWHAPAEAGDLTVDGGLTVNSNLVVKGTTDFSGGAVSNATYHGDGYSLTNLNVTPPVTNTTTEVLGDALKVGRGYDGSLWYWLNLLGANGFELVFGNTNTGLTWNTTSGMLVGQWEISNDADAGQEIVNYQTMANYVGESGMPTLAEVLAVGRAADATGTILDSGGATVSLDLNNRCLLDGSGNTTADWGYRSLYDGMGNTSVEWDTRYLYDSSWNSSVDWGYRYLYDSMGNTSVEWDAQTLRDDSGIWTSEGTATSGEQIVNYQTMTSYITDRTTAGDLDLSAYAGDNIDYSNGQFHAAGADGDDLGNHTATADLNMAGQNVMNVGDLMASGNLYGNGSTLTGIDPPVTNTTTTAFAQGVDIAGQLTVGTGNTSLASNATIAGGLNNTIGGNAVAAVIPGGEDNTANGSHSFAAGEQATAEHDNTFVWSDGTATSSTNTRQFTVHASNGIRLLGGPTQIAWIVPQGDLSMGSFTNGPSL